MMSRSRMVWRSVVHLAIVARTLISFSYLLITLSAAGVFECVARVPLGTGHTKGVSSGQGPLGTGYAVCGVVKMDLML